MATSVTFNNNTYSIPANREPRGWGTSLSAFLIDVANNSLSKAGGNFALTADINYGATYGLVSKYFKSYSSNISKTGVVRLANNEGIGWRDSTNTDGQDKVLRVSVSDRLQFDSVNIPTVSSSDTLTNKTLTSPVINSPTGIVKGDVGLGNVDNTSDANKPVSTATQAALNLKANLNNPAFTGTVSGITAGMVGLGNVDNTSDANKPVSTATQTALNLKYNASNPSGFITASTTDTLTNKTVTAPVFNSFTDYSFVAAPATPASGVRVYGKSDGKLYKIDSASGIESAIGGGLAPEPKSANFTAVAGKHYLCNTSGGAITVTLPAGAAEAAIKFSDASETWDSYAVTITPASGQKIDNLATNESLVCDVKRGWVELSWNTALSSWSLQSLSATNVVEASATQAGVVTTGTQTFAGTKTFDAINITSGTFEIGFGRAADGNSYVDFTSQSGAVDYNARIIRGSGANADWTFTNLGTANIIFATSGTERMRIQSDGRIFLGAAAAGGSSNIGLMGALGYQTRAGYAAGSFGGNIFNIQHGTGQQLWIDSTNMGTIAYTSDYRIKENITPQEQSGLERVLKLRPVEYQFKDVEMFKGSPEIRQGFIAHEVQEVIPSAVSGQKDELTEEGAIQPQSLRLDALIAVLTKAIQELSAKVDVQAAQLAQLLPPAIEPAPVAEVPSVEQSTEVVQETLVEQPLAESVQEPIVGQPILEPVQEPAVVQAPSVEQTPVDQNPV